MTSNRGLSKRCSTFRREPVKKLSTQMTSLPSERSRSDRWEPMKPAPPVIRTLDDTSVAYQRVAETICRSPRVRPIAPSSRPRNIGHPSASVIGFGLRPPYRSPEIGRAAGGEEGGPEGVNEG